MGRKDSARGEVGQDAGQIGVGADGDDARAGGGIGVREVQCGPTDGPDPRIEGEKRGQQGKECEKCAANPNTFATST